MAPNRPMSMREAFMFHNLRTQGDASLHFDVVAGDLEHISADKKGNLRKL
jgi:hypothetical protein